MVLFAAVSLPALFIEGLLSQAEKIIAAAIETIQYFIMKHFPEYYTKNNSSYNPGKFSSHHKECTNHQKCIEKFYQSLPSQSQIFQQISKICLRQGIKDPLYNLTMIALLNNFLSFYLLLRFPSTLIF
jgi:hypothetical protein